MGLFPETCQWCHSHLTWAKKCGKPICGPCIWESGSVTEKSFDEDEWNTKEAIAAIDGFQETDNGIRLVFRVRRKNRLFIGLSLMSASGLFLYTLTGLLVVEFNLTSKIVWGMLVGDLFFAFLFVLGALELRKKHIGKFVSAFFANSENLSWIENGTQFHLKYSEISAIRFNDGDGPSFLVHFNEVGNIDLYPFVQQFEERIFRYIRTHYRGKMVWGKVKITDPLEKLPRIF